jgi:hypothetical protein
MATQTELDDWADFALGSELLIFCNSVLDRTDEVYRSKHKLLLLIERLACSDQ